RAWMTGCIARACWASRNERARAISGADARRRLHLILSFDSGGGKGVRGLRLFRAPLRSAVPAGAPARSAHARPRGAGSRGSGANGERDASARRRASGSAWRTFVRRTAVEHAGGRKAGTGGWAAAALVPAASAAQAGATANLSLPQLAN